MTGQPSRVPSEPPADVPFERPEDEDPGTDGDDGRLRRPTDYSGEGIALVAFVPAESIESATFLSWLNLEEDVDVMLVSDARPSAAESNSILAKGNVPMLVDPDGFVAREYGVDFDDLSEGTVVLVDSTKQIRQTWSTDIDPMDIYVTVRRHLELDLLPAEEADTR